MEMLRIFVLCLELSDTLHGHVHTCRENYFFPFLYFVVPTLTRPEHPSRQERQDRRQKVIQGTELPGSEEPEDHKE